MRKHPQCRWVLALPWNQKGGTDAAAPASDDRELEDCSRSQVARRVSSKTPSASWSNSWSTELGLPVRVRGVGKHEVREVRLPVEIPPGAADDDTLIGKFSDGSEFVITDLSIGDYRALKSGRVQKAKITPVWQGVHNVTHNQLCLQQRTDRCMLLSLYEQSKQILQVELWKFGAMPVGPPSPVPNNHECVSNATTFLMPMVLAYQADEIKSHAELKHVKNEKLKALLRPTSTASAFPMKRPSSQTAASSSRGPSPKVPRGEDLEELEVEPDPFTPPLEGLLEQLYEQLRSRLGAH
jgi:hypothetical protein